MSTFDEAAQDAANRMRVELRESAGRRLKDAGGNQSVRAQCHEAFMGGHAKGFAAGWLAATRAAPHVPGKRELEAMAREVCAPFSAERAVRA